MSHEQTPGHEQMACDLLAASNEYDTTDEWSRMRAMSVTAQASAHAQIATAQAANRLATALERIARHMEQGGGN